MKKIFILSALAIGITYADYKVTYPLDSNYVKFKNAPVTEIWVPGTSVLGVWTNKGTLFNCNVTPLVNGSFTHLKRCSQQQTQTVKTPETSNITHEVRYNDSSNEKTITINENLTESWTEGSPVLSEWVDKDELFDCSMLPSVNDYSTGVSFTQTKTCSQKQEQSVTTPQTSSITNDVRQVETLNEQVITKSTDNNAVGERYTHIMKVGYYTLSTVNHYYGYVNPNTKNYQDQYSAIVEHNPSTLTPNVIGGLEIRWMYTLAYDGNLVITPANKSMQNNLLKYNLTINGVTCPLAIATYEADFVVGKNCFSFLNKAGSEFKMDVTLK